MPDPHATAPNHPGVYVHAQYPVRVHAPCVRSSDIRNLSLSCVLTLSPYSMHLIGKFIRVFTYLYCHQRYEEGRGNLTKIDENSAMTKIARLKGLRTQRQRNAMINSWSYMSSRCDCAGTGHVHCIMYNVIPAV